MRFPGLADRGGSQARLALVPLASIAGRCRVTGERARLRARQWQVATSEGESQTAYGVDSPVAVGGRIAQGQWLFSRGRAGFACVNKPGWLWPLRMAKRVSERATRGGEHGGVGTPHARGVSGEILGFRSDEASSVSFCLCARWLVSSLTRRRGGPPALRPSGCTQWQRPCRKLDTEPLGSLGTLRVVGLVVVCVVVCM